MFRFLLIISCVLVAVLGATNVQKCDGNIPLPVYVDIGGCVEPPCDMVRGETAISKMKINIDRDTTALRPEIKAKVFGITITYNLPDDILIGCNFLIEGSCPLTAGEEVVYQLEQPVDKATPQVNPVVTFTLFDSENKPVVCYSFAARIV